MPKNFVVSKRLHNFMVMERRRKPKSLEEDEDQYLRKALEKREARLKEKEGKKKVRIGMRFTEEELVQVEVLSKLGATTAQLAMFFRVDMSTIDTWIQKSKDFQMARQRGGIEADMKVADSLYKRAVGFHYDEEEKLISAATGEVRMVKRTRKYVVPDTKAAIQWLKVRQREVWTLPELHLHGGKVEHLHRRLQDIPVQDLSQSAKEVLFELTQKSLTAGEQQ